jgi:iron complex transport system permease protein
MGLMMSSDKTTTARSTSTVAITIAVLALTLILAIIVATGMGYIAIDGGKIVRIILAQLFDTPDLLGEIEKNLPYVVIEVRLPRILSAALVGAGLAVAGVIYQGILRNPLADPYTLGISSGAAFGASVALLANLSVAAHFSTPLFAFVGAVATLAVVLRLSSFNGQISAQTLILSGVIVGAILSAGISFLKYLADEQVAIIIFWLMGSFAAATWKTTLLAAVTVCLGCMITLYYGRDLNIVSLGRRSADSLGVDTVRVRLILLITASLLAAVCVSTSGIIGFIGLIVPHLMRYLVGPDHRRLLPTSALAGALLLLFADTLTRAVLPVEVPIGVLTALIGGPFFCVIFRQKQKGSGYE